MKIDLSNNDSLYKVNISLLKLAFLPALSFFYLPFRSALSITFLDPVEMKELNKNWYANKATDILSFPFYSSIEEIYAEEFDQFYIGEIFIALEVVEKKRREKSIPIAIDVLRLIFHGLLHLLGYDHRTLVEKERMFEIQNRLLYIALNTINYKDLVVIP